MDKKFGTCDQAAGGAGGRGPGHGGRAVIYARFSCSKQREASIEDQLRVCRDWCGREGYGVVAEYCDYAVSGRTDDRPRFQDMIANAGESDIVLVYMMDRFSRSEYDAPIYKKELARHGVEVVSAMESLPDGPERVLVEKIYEGLAAVESAKTSIRVRRGMTGNAMKCLHNGVRVYGYSVGPDGRYIVDEDEAAVVREAFARRAGGETCHSIASDLARRGVRTATGRPCSPNMVHKMVKSRKYIGEYSWGDVTVPGGMPAIVDEVMWERCRRVKARRDRSADDWGGYALTGRAVCASCGHLMAGMSGRGRGGVKYEYYGCANGDVKPVRRDWLEGEIVDGVRDLLERGDADMLAERAAAMANGSELEDRRRAARSSLKRATDGIANIVGAIESGVASEALAARLSQLEDERREAERELSRLRAREVDPGRLAEFLRSRDGLSDGALLDAFVYQAAVSGDSVLVTLNYDTEKREPARFDVERVRMASGWCPVGKSGRTRFGIIGCTPLLLISRTQG